MRRSLFLLVLCLYAQADVSLMMQLYDANTNGVLEWSEMQTLFIDVTGSSNADSISAVNQSLLFLDFNSNRVLDGAELAPALDFFVQTWGLEIPAAMQVTKNVSYGADPLHSFDVYAPENPVDAPVIIFIHGGNWSYGDKRKVYQQPAFFTSHGFMYISINYRLTTETSGVQHPDHIDDAAAAITHIQAHVGNYGGDPDNMVLMGFSAGAQLASLAFTHPRYTAQYGDDAFRCVVLLDGSFTDMPRLYDLSWSEHLEAAFGSSPAVHFDASAVHRVRFAPPGTSFAPCMFVQQGHLGLAMALELGTELEARGGSYERVYVPSKSHTDVPAHLGRTGDPMSWQVLDFIQRHVD